MFGGLLGRLDAARGTITLIMLALSAAGLYAWGATMRADRDRLIATADGICAAAGSAIEISGRKRGADCRAAVVRLAQFERETRTATADTLAQAMADRDRKTQADIAAALRAADQARAAAVMMEKAENAIAQDNLVGADWFGALNRAGGLRPPGS